MVRWPFSRFARRPEQPSWDVVVRRSSIGLAALRARWYSECVETLDRNSIPIANRGLTGRGEQAAIAFQLMVISYFLPDTPYVPREQGPDFAHRLYLEVAGALLVDVMRYVERYDEVSGGQQLIRFSWDIARHATGKDAVGLAGPLLAPNAVTLTWISRTVVASAFGDERGAEELHSKMLDELSRLAQRSRE